MLHSPGVIEAKLFSVLENKLIKYLNPFVVFLKSKQTNQQTFFPFSWSVFRSESMDYCNHTWLIRYRMQRQGEGPGFWRRMPTPQAVRGDGRKRGCSDRGNESLAGEASSGWVLKKCKDSPPEAVPWGSSLFKAHLGSSKHNISKGLCGLFLPWLFWLGVGSTRWWCVLYVPMGLAIWGLLSPNPSRSWLRTDAEGGRRSSHIVTGGVRGRNGWWKGPFHRYTTWWSTPCIISLHPHFSLMEERTRR